jgi:transcriptional regulator with XRE-family HTH domain
MSLRLASSSRQQATEDRIDEELSRIITQLTDEINWHMRERGITRADLADRMGVSPGRVSQVLSGGENLTLRTLVGLATALDARFEVELNSLTDTGYAGRAMADAGEAAAENYRPLPRADRFEEASASGVPTRARG